MVVQICFARKQSDICIFGFEFVSFKIEKWEYLFFSQYLVKMSLFWVINILFDAEISSSGQEGMF